MEFEEPEGAVRLTGVEDIPSEAIKSMRVQVDDLASGQLVYIPAQTLANGREVLASCDRVENGHVHASVSNPNRLPVEIHLADLRAETLDRTEWTEYQFRWDPREEVVCGMVGADAPVADQPVPEPLTELPVELERIVSRIDPPLDPTAEKELRQLLLTNRDVFALEGEPLGRTGWVQHAIRLKDSTPIKQPPRRVPIHREHVVDTEMEKMKIFRAIHPSESPWALPIVLFLKKDGTIRFCVDYRKVNDVTIKDAYPLPRVEESLEALQGSTYFSTLDLKSGYWQVEMREEDKPITAFTTKLYEWNVMPFRLTNAPAMFQRLMERCNAMEDPGPLPGQYNHIRPYRQRTCATASHSTRPMPKSRTKTEGLKV
jgi:hypothetical protein